MAASDDRPVTDEVKRVFDDPAALAERLQRQAERTESMTEAAVEGDDPVVASAREERDRIVDQGIDGLTKVAEGRDDEVTPDEEFGMEAIILLEGRPAILIQQGDFLQPPNEWSHLADRRDAMREVIARVGRVEVDGHLDLDWIGTGFLVGSTTVMTNRHVAEEFSRRGGADTWTFSRHVVPAGLPRRARLDDAAGVRDQRRDRHPRRSRPGPAAGGERLAAADSLPTPLTVAARAPEDLTEREVYVVGYPAWDGRRNEPEPMRRIFMEIFNVKRLQPGKAVAFLADRPAMQHDCSTLGGNSGSPVIDLDTHDVIGLHFGGRYGVGNYAVPLWELTQDPLLRAGDVNFN